MANPGKLATLGTQDKNKQKTQHSTRQKQTKKKPQHSTRQKQTK